MRIISLNVDGIHQAAQRGLYDWFTEQDADIVCLQDLRCSEPEMDDAVFHPEDYHVYIFESGIANCNGVAIYTRHLPKALIYGLGFSSGVDMEGRYLQIDFDTLSIGSLLAPSAREDYASQEVKAQFFDDFQAHLVKISRKRRDFIFCGNWEIAPSKADVSNPDEQQHQSGFLSEEKLWMSQLPQIGYIDAFRRGNADKDEYSWWPSGRLGEGEAMRTDLQIVSASLKNHVDYAMIYKNRQFSSHLPVIVDYDVELVPDF